MTGLPLPTKELQCYTYLQGRKRLSRNERLTHHNLCKGYLGERKFAQFVDEQLDNNYLALYGILLEDRGTLFQIDCLLIFSNQIYLIEIKNYQGEFELKDDSLYECIQQKSYRNPLHQLKRSSLLFHDLLLRNRVNLPVQSRLVFNNNQFTLFHAERQTSIILPTQLQSFIEQLRKIPDNLQAKHYRIADHIKKLHIPVSPYERQLDYEYNTLQKGVLCVQCRSKMNLYYRHLHCVNCPYKERIDSGILRSTIEYQVLFPDKKIKSGTITSWCAGIVTIRTVSRILLTYLHRIEKGKESHYVFHSAIRK